MSVDLEQQEGPHSDPSEDVQATQEEVRAAFWMAVDRGHTRLDRHWLGLIATGAAAGLDVAIGAFGLLIVMTSTRNLVLASLTFSIGFIIVVFADSELFTENFLIPLSAVLAGTDNVVRLVRLWGATLVTNLGFGWVIAAILVSGFPDIKQQAIQLSRAYLTQGFGWRSFSAAVFAGALVTLMTWMNSITTTQSTRLFSALIVGYVLALGQMPHCIVSGIEFSMALVGGAPFGYAAALKVIGWMVLGNMAGGVVLASGLRLTQVTGIELRRRLPEYREGTLGEEISTGGLFGLLPDRDADDRDDRTSGDGGGTDTQRGGEAGYRAFRRGSYIGEDESGFGRPREQEAAPQPTLARLPRVEDTAPTLPGGTSAQEQEEHTYRSFYKSFEKGFYTPQPEPAPQPAGPVDPSPRGHSGGGSEATTSGPATQAPGGTTGSGRVETDPADPSDLPAHHRIFRAIKDSSPTPLRPTSGDPDPLA